MSSGTPREVLRARLETVRAGGEPVSAMLAQRTLERMDRQDAMDEARVRRMRGRMWLGRLIYGGDTEEDRAELARLSEEDQECVRRMRALCARLGTHEPG